MRRVEQVSKARKRGRGGWVLRTGLPIQSGIPVARDRAQPSAGDRRGWRIDDPQRKAHVQDRINGLQRVLSRPLFTPFTIERDLAMLIAAVVILGGATVGWWGGR